MRQWRWASEQALCGAHAFNWVCTTSPGVRTELGDACTQNWHIYESGQSVRTELYVCLCVYRTGVFVNPEFARMAGLHQEEMAAR